MPRTPAAPSEPPRVLSLFIELPRGAVKHGYSFQHAAKVPAPYLVYGTQPAIGRIAAARAAAGLLTELREIDIGGLRNLSAASLGVSPAALELAARRSVDATHCPSWELVLIWLSKLPLLATAMRAEPALPRWAWVDVGLTPTGRPADRELPLTPPAPIAGQASTSTACCAGGRRPRHGLASGHAAGASPSPATRAAATTSCGAPTLAPASSAPFSTARAPPSYAWRSCSLRARAATSCGWPRPATPAPSCCAPTRTCSRRRWRTSRPWSRSSRSRSASSSAGAGRRPTSKATTRRDLVGEGSVQRRIMLLEK
mmetsp:Transcript_7588/g.22230  ORF Transcript_7588/g.22230 Transcript_7588/m.22230 type:complete len:313 (+) Transcript_7588:76-1014(+)